MGKLVGAQDYQQWALPIHAAFPRLAFRVGSSHLLTQESVIKPPEGLVRIWPLGQEGRNRCGVKGMGER